MRIRLKTGLSQESFALLLGMGKKTIQRYECGGRVIPSTAKLLRVIDRHPEVLMYYIEDDKLTDDRE